MKYVRHNYSCKNDRHGVREPLRKFSEVAEALGVPEVKLRAMFARDPNRPRQAEGVPTSGGVYYRMSEVRRWWAERQVTA